jgi:Peptidase family M28
MLREIEALVEFRGRAPGTDAERRAAEHLANRLREIGRDAEVEPIHVYPNYPVAHTIHALLAIAGSVLSVSRPAIGAVLVLVAMLSTFGDLTGVFYAVRRLTGRRASQNVLSRVDAGRDGTLVLVAHYDAARSGVVFGRRALERRAVLGKLLRRPIGLFEPFFWSIVVVLACTILRVAGIDALLLTIVQFVFTVVLIVSVPLLLDIALSDPVPGANDNASGVATVLRLAERYGYVLDHFQVCVLFTGAEEGMLGGMREWMRRHRKELAPERTVFLNVDKVGAGTVRFTTKEGLVIASPYHPTLISLCEEIADEDEEEGRYGARGLVSRHVTDAYAARTAGFPAITISCANALDYVPEYHQHTDTTEHIDPEALDRAYGFCCELIERLDARVGADLAAASSDEETALSEEEPV